MRFFFPAVFVLNLVLVACINPIPPERGASETLPSGSAFQRPFTVYYQVLPAEDGTPVIQGSLLMDTLEDISCRVPRITLLPRTEAGELPVLSFDDGPQPEELDFPVYGWSRRPSSEAHVLPRKIRCGLVFPPTFRALSNVALHEIGHLLGYAHGSDCNELMGEESGRNCSELDVCLREYPLPASAPERPPCPAILLQWASQDP